MSQIPYILAAIADKYVICDANKKSFCAMILFVGRLFWNVKVIRWKMAIESF